ncbi:THAP domain-containing protein 1-like [Aphis craccivora]|uniref:THAP domain-containing protein 1-like n=1 Tax=Aphis craccivora TaxID=307492 RepID=A0A6G0YI16_APHCR|nr:THAP domain-containing protein 1-like [Aphis craccivora]
MHTGSHNERRASGGRITVRLLSGNFINKRLYEFGLLISNLHLSLMVWRLCDDLAAYRYVRQTFNKCLPYSSTLRKWYAVVDSTPGFTKELINAIQIKVAEMKS